MSRESHLLKNKQLKGLKRFEGYLSGLTFWRDTRYEIRTTKLYIVKN